MGVGLNGSGALAEPEQTRGKGFLCLDLANIATDMETLHRALVRWPARFRKIDPELRDRMVKEAQVSLDNAAMLQDPVEAEKVRINALRVLTVMDKLNFEDESRALNHAVPDRKTPSQTNIQVNAENVSLRAAFK